MLLHEALERATMREFCTFKSNDVTGQQEDTNLKLKRTQWKGSNMMKKAGSTTINIYAATFLLSNFFP